MNVWLGIAECQDIVDLCSRRAASLSTDDVGMAKAVLVSRLKKLVKELEEE